MIHLFRSGSGWEIYDASADRGEVYEYPRRCCSFVAAALQAGLWAALTGQSLTFTRP